MHPTLAEQLAKAIQSDRLAQAAHARLVRDARGQRGAEAGGRRSNVRAFGPLVLLRLRRLLTAAMGAYGQEGAR